MIKCPRCKKKFTYRSRFKALLDKSKILKCENCGSEYSQSLFQVKMSFYFSAIIYVLFNSRISLFLGRWIYSDFIKEILKLAIGVIWMIIFVYLSQFCSKYTKYN